MVSLPRSTRDGAFKLPYDTTKFGNSCLEICFLSVIPPYTKTIAPFELMCIKLLLLSLLTFILYPIEFCFTFKDKLIYNKKGIQRTKSKTKRKSGFAYFFSLHGHGGSAFISDYIFTCSCVYRSNFSA